MRTKLLVLLTSACATGCSSTQGDGLERQALVVEVSGGKLSAPETVRAGWINLSVEDEGEGHIVVAFMMPTGARRDDIGAFIEALDTARMTPSGAVAVGGPEISHAGEVIVELQTGLYVLACLSRDEEEHRHARAGEWRALEVGGVAAGEPPAASVKLNMIDYVYHTDTPWPSGAHMVEVVNNGREDHQVRIDRLAEGVTFQDWMRAEERDGLSEPISGVARTSPGRSVYLPINPGPGTYVLYCLIPMSFSGAPHAMMGMVREIVVEQAHAAES